MATEEQREETTTEEEDRFRTVPFIRFPGVWVLVAAGWQSLIAFTWSTGAWTVFVRVFMKEFGWSAALMGGVSTIRRINGVWIHPIAGWFGDNYGPRWAVGIGLCFMTACWIGFPFMIDYWHLLVTYSTLLAMGSSMGLNRGVQIAIVRWWLDRRALGLGVRSLVAGLSGTIGLPLAAWYIQEYGWQNGAWLAAAMTGILCVPASWLYPSHMPEDYGLYADNLTPGMRREKAEREAAKKGVQVRVRPALADLTIGEALRDRAFWMLVIALSTRSVGGAPLGIFQNARMGTLGYSVVEAAIFYSYQRFSSYIGRFAITFGGDWLTRKFPVRVGLAVILWMQATGLLLFGVGTTPFWFYAWAVIHGSAAGASDIWYPILMASYFGRRAFGTVYGVRMAITSGIGFFAPVMMGWLADMFGWTTPFAVGAFFVGLAGFLMLLATPPKKQLRETQRAETVY